MQEQGEFHIQKSCNELSCVLFTMQVKIRTGEVSASAVERRARGTSRREWRRGNQSFASSTLPHFSLHSREAALAASGEASLFFYAAVAASSLSAREQHAGMHETWITALGQFY